MESKAVEKIIYFPSSASVTGSGGGRIQRAQKRGLMDSGSAAGTEAGRCGGCWALRECLLMAAVAAETNHGP